MANELQLAYAVPAELLHTFRLMDKWSVKDKWDTPPPFMSAIIGSDDIEKLAESKTLCFEVPATSTSEAFKVDITLGQAHAISSDVFFLFQALHTALLEPETEQDRMTVLYMLLINNGTPSERHETMVSADSRMAMRDYEARRNREMRGGYIDKPY